MKLEVDKQSECSNRPRLIIGIYIVNFRNEILLLRSPKWSNLLCPPGGQVEYGESIEAAITREVKEETSLDIKNPVLLTIIELIEPKNFTAYQAHFVGLQYRVELTTEEQTVRLSAEHIEQVWLEPNEIVKRTDIEPCTAQVIKDYLLNNKNQIDGTNGEKSTDEYKAGWQRAIADYQNLQKEVERMRAEWVKFSELEIVEEFLPVYINFKKAFNFAINEKNTANGETDSEHQFDSWKKGIEYIMKQFGDVLKAHGIEEMKVVGELFEATRHESVGEEAVDGTEPGRILREVETGFIMHGKIIKPAKVIIVN